MTLEEIRGGLSDMLVKLGNVQPEFSKQKYPVQFEERCHEAEDFLFALRNEYEKLEDSEKEAFLDSIADAPVEGALAELDKIPKKRQKETKQMEMNLAMVTYVNPVILKFPADFSESLTDKIIENWNQAFPKMKIKKATYEMIMSGFKRKFCYVTTAVCMNQGKSDDCYELCLLRDFRDGYLSQTEEGLHIIDEYYNIAPTIVHRIEDSENASFVYGQLYENYIVPCIRLIEQNQFEDCVQKYEDMVESLRDHYLYRSETRPDRSLRS